MAKFSYYPSRYYPKYVVWEVTFACNMNCLHCGSIAGGGKTRPNELNTDEVLDVCDQLAELGTEWVTLAGGELFLRKDWHLIVKRLKEHNIKVSIITNGWLLEKNIKLLKEVRPDYVAISIDGIGETHDFIRQKPGSFERASKGLDLLKENNLGSGVVTCISRINIHQLEQLYDFLKTKSITSWQMQLIISEGRGKLKPEWIPTFDDLHTLINFIAHKRQVSNFLIYPGDNIGYYTPYEEYIRYSNWKGCFAGILAMGIEADGGIKGCLSLCPELFKDNPFVEGNLREESIEKIWNRKGAFSYNRNFDKRKVKGFCKQCKNLDDCRCGCISTAYAITKSRYKAEYCLYKILEEKKKKVPLNLPKPQIKPIRFF